MTIRFQFAADKAAAAIQRMVEAHPGIDLHAALKACYFADKSHLNAHHRPVFGARYRAMKFGPVPLEIYEMMKGEAYWLPEIGVETYPWSLEGHTLKKAGGNAPIISNDVFSASDLKHLDAAIAQSVGMSFTNRTAATHQSDWRNANMGLMAYEDMLDESELKPEIIEYLRENASILRI